MANKTGSRNQKTMLGSSLGRNFVGQKSQRQPKGDARFDDQERFVNQAPPQPQLRPTTFPDISRKEKVYD
jgi:hypothetical protein